MNHNRTSAAVRAWLAGATAALALAGCSLNMAPPTLDPAVTGTQVPAGQTPAAAATQARPATGQPQTAPTAQNKPAAPPATTATASSAVATTKPTAPAPTPAQAKSGVAARVNGTEIPRAKLEQEIVRYMAGDPAAPKPESPEGVALAAQLRDLVLDGMIEQTLIEQEASRTRITVSEKDIADEISAIVELQGGQDKFQAWLKTSGLTDADLREIARQELVASAVREKVTASLPKSAEYVHAFHILVNTEPEAQQILKQLQSGSKFDVLAKSKSIDPSTAPQGGDLDWFAKGTGAVLWEEVENAAFELKPGQVSGVVKSPVGYHIVKVTQRETRPLTAEDAAFLQQTAFEQWLEQQKGSAKIERLP